MLNYFNLETEAAHWQREWERTLAAMTRVEQSRPENGRWRWSQLPDLVLTYLGSLITPRGCQSRHRCSAERSSATTLAGGRIAGI